MALAVSLTSSNSSYTKSSKRFVNAFGDLGGILEDIPRLVLVFVIASIAMMIGTYLLTTFAGFTGQNVSQYQQGSLAYNLSKPYVNGQLAFANMSGSFGTFIGLLMIVAVAGILLVILMKVFSQKAQ